MFNPIDGVVMHMRSPFPKAALLSLSLLWLAGCTMPGDLAEGVDPVEGRLAQQLIAESCGNLRTVDADGQFVSRRAIPAEELAILEISDTYGGGRQVWFRLWAREYRVAYHSDFAMVKCDVQPYEPTEWVLYTHPSPMLIERGGDPKLYEALLKEVEQEEKEAEMRANLLDASFPIHVQWEGMAEPLTGVLREVRSGSKGTIAIELPNTLGMCVGEYTYSGRNVGTWKVTCPDALTASGTFQSGAGAHGQGTDSAGRNITYTVDVGS